MHAGIYQGETFTKCHHIPGRRLLIRFTILTMQPLNQANPINNSVLYGNNF